MDCINLIDFRKVHALVDQGYIATRHHDTLPLTIYNYTSKTQFEGLWRPETVACRGLIVHDSGEIVARPFDKFFNWGERGATTDAALTSVTEKWDGSLGILYRADGEHRIATRGSFDGEQAVWATEFLNAHYHDIGAVGRDWTYLFEIIYPENRVVVDYGDLEDLVLLAARNRLTGRYVTPQQLDMAANHFGFAMPKSYSFGSVSNVLQALDGLTGNEEGFVAEFADGSRFKFKGEAYKELHRLISGVSFKRVLEAVEQGNADEYLAKIPEEFRDQAEQWRTMIDFKVCDTRAAIKTAFSAAPKTDRKTFALWVREYAPDLSSYLFLMLDGRDPTPMIYKREF